MVSNIIDLSDRGHSNVPALPDSELTGTAKDSNVALVVKIIDACDNDARLCSHIFTQKQTSVISWPGKLSMSLSIFYISTFKNFLL